MQTTIFNEDEVKALLSGVAQVRSLASVPESFADEVRHEVAQLSKQHSAEFRIEIDTQYLTVMRFR